MTWCMMHDIRHMIYNNQYNVGCDMTRRDVTRRDETRRDVMWSVMTRYDTERRFVIQIMIMYMWIWLQCHQLQFQTNTWIKQQTLELNPYGNLFLNMSSICLCSSSVFWMYSWWYYSQIPISVMIRDATLSMMHLAVCAMSRRAIHGSWYVYIYIYV